METDSPTNQKHSKYTVSVRIKPNINNEPVCLISHKSKFIKEMKPKSIVTYGFDQVFEQNHDNAYIYQQSLKKNVSFFINKKINTTILAYGQTGSGKTFTLFGSKTKQQPGLVDYMIDDIVEFVISKGLTAKCSFLQIYKEKVSDLMTSQTVQLRQNSNGDLILENLKVYEIGSKQQLNQLLKEAHSNKIFGNSYINSQSSRSHVIFTIQVQKRKFNVVDLCGSQVLTYKFNEQQREETNSINLSLFTLNAVVNDLAFKQKGKNQFIPFRNSVLTRILKQSLLDLNKSQIYLFCNVSPQQKHQSFSSSTLRFGQLAIQIDQANNTIEQKVNLSQQKRQKKMVSNIIQMTPPTNQTAATYSIAWNTKIVKILSNNIKIYELLKEGAICNVLILHAYGYGCCGDDWNLHISYLTKILNANIYSVDFPGFGNSQGKKFTSRSQKFEEKDQPIEFMSKLFEVLGFTTKNKIILMGYDLGGAIGLSSCLNKKLSKCVESLIVFHPTWTDSIQKLAPILIPTLILWFAVETFHLISAGQKMSKIIKNSKLYKFNVGPYTNEKAGGYYDNYSETMSKIVSAFIMENNKSVGKKVQNENEDNRLRGKIIEQNIQISINQQEQQLKNAVQSVRDLYRMKEENSMNEVFQTLIKGGSLKPKYVRLTSQIPNFNLNNFNWKFLQRYNLFSKIPANTIDFNELPLFQAGQQVQITTKIHLSCLQGNNQYLSFEQKGQFGITHKAFILDGQNEQQIYQKQAIKVKVKNINNDYSIIPIPLTDLLYLNSPTAYKCNTLGHLVFQDSVTCNYQSNFVKLKLVQCCFHLQQIVSKMDFSIDNQTLLQQQKQCSQIIYQLIDLKHLVHEGIDNTRYTGIDVGRLAFYGQGNCHHLASVTAALLLPFGKVLGWDIMFRAGSFFKTNREIDENGIPLKQWNGKPRVNVEDHTWLQIRYKPSYKIFVFDPSFGICSQPLDQIYTLQGKMHISGKKLNFAADYNTQIKLLEK